VAEVVFIITDFFLAAGADEPRTDADAIGHPDTSAHAGQPRLPLLETLLARAHRETLQPDWRGWLTARAAGGPPSHASASGLSMAQTVAAAWERPQGPAQPPGQVWLASPVHYFAGLDSIYLHRAGVLQLDDAEQHALVADFERVFAGSAWSLRAIGRRELLLSGPMIAADGADPAQYAGCDPSAGMPRGADAGALRGLGAEMEMWLYEHPLNLERRSRGDLPVTTLWLWGAQHNPRQPPACGPQPHTPLPPLYGSDSYAEALWRLRGAAPQALPARFEALPHGARAGAIILYSLLQPPGPGAALLQLEQRWLPGAFRALRHRHIGGVRVLAGTRDYALHWLDLGRLWRSRTPWWETLA
jgi:hypothetical protein